MNFLKNKALEIANLDDGSSNSVIITNKFRHVIFSRISIFAIQNFKCLHPNNRSVLGWLDAGRWSNHSGHSQAKCGTYTRSAKLTNRYIFRLEKIRHLVKHGNLGHLQPHERMFMTILSTVLC